VSTKKFAAVGGIIRPLGGILEVPKTAGFFFFRLKGGRSGDTSGYLNQLDIYKHSRNNFFNNDFLHVKHTMTLFERINIW
jgi:hypothetical protein